MSKINNTNEHELEYEKVYFDYLKKQHDILSKNKTGPYILEGDEDTFYKVNKATGKEALHEELLPQIVFGDLKHAKIIILSINPNLGSNEKELDRKYRNQLLEQLLQGEDYHRKHMFLSGEYKEHGGTRYWRQGEPKENKIGKRARPGMFNKIKEEVVNSYRKRGKDVASDDVFKMLSCMVATLERCPYHSEKYNYVYDELPSCDKTVEYVKKVLVPRAERHEVLLVITRGFKFFYDISPELKGINDKKTKNKPRMSDEEIAERLGEMYKRNIVVKHPRNEQGDSIPPIDKIYGKYSAYNAIIEFIRKETEEFTISPQEYLNK